MFRFQGYYQTDRYLFVRVNDKSWRFDPETEEWDQVEDD